MSNVDKAQKCDVAVVEAGADGLAAAIATAEQAKTAGTRRIVLLVGTKMIGAKILVSGDGRCNITHEVVTPTDFFGNRHKIMNVTIICLTRVL